jgi:OmpA-OmpF porin, OOP family
MKQTFFLAGMPISTILFTKDYNYEITPMIGYNTPEGNSHLENQTLISMKTQIIKTKLLY